MKYPPIVERLKNCEYADTIDQMLDAGRSANEVHKFLESVDYEVSLSSIYKYANMRREQLLETRAETTDYARINNEQTDRLRSELELLDTLIERGFQAIQEMELTDITPKMALDAIRLKHELTGGNHAALTPYGYSTLKQLEDQRWNMVTACMMTFIPEEKLPQVRQDVERIEESVFRGTPWEDEYLKSKEQAAPDA